MDNEEDFRTSDPEEVEAEPKMSSNEEIQELFNALIAKHDFQQIERLFGRDAVAVARKLAYQKPSKVPPRRKSKAIESESSEEGEASEFATIPTKHQGQVPKRGKVIATGGALKPSTENTDSEVPARNWIPPAQSSKPAASRKHIASSEHVHNSSNCLEAEEAKPTSVSGLKMICEDGGLNEEVEVLEYTSFNQASLDRTIYSNQRKAVGVSLSRAKEAIPQESVPLSPKLPNVELCAPGNCEAGPSQTICLGDEPGLSDAAEAAFDDRDLVRSLKQSGTSETLPLAVEPPRFTHNFVFPRDKNPPEQFSNLPACYFLHDILFL